MSYVDFCLRPRSVKDAEKMAELIPRLGISVVGVEGDKGMLKPFIDRGIETYHRITIKASNAGEAVRMLREARGRYDIVALYPANVETARLAARDERVDIVHLVPAMAKYMDRSEALLLRMGGGVIEVGLSRLVRLEPRQLRGFMIIVRRASAYEAPFIASSCATTVWDLWHPRLIQSILVFTGVPENLAKLSVRGSILLNMLRTRRGE